MSKLIDLGYASEATKGEDPVVSLFDSPIEKKLDMVNCPTFPNPYALLGTGTAGYRCVAH